MLPLPRLAMRLEQALPCHQLLRLSSLRSSQPPTLRFRRIDSRLDLSVFYAASLYYPPHATFPVQLTLDSPSPPNQPFPSAFPAVFTLDSWPSLATPHRIAAHLLYQCLFSNDSMYDCVLPPTVLLAYAKSTSLRPFASLPCEAILLDVYLDRVYTMI